MFLYANKDCSPISQLAINKRTAKAYKQKQIDLEYNVCHTVFDYDTDSSLPPCPHFLDNFLTSRVYVFSLPLDSKELSNIQSNLVFEEYCNEFIGYPKTAVDNNFEIGWVGIEEQDATFIVSNIQINGLYKDVIENSKAKKIYKTMLNWVLQQETQRPVYVPTAQTLKKLTDRFSNHPQRAIMETPYTSTVLKGFRKTNFTGNLYANKYLHADEVEMYVKD